MENVRLVLFIALAFVLFSLWQAWQRDYGPQPQAPVAEPTGAPGQPQRDDLPEAPAAVSAAAPEVSSDAAVLGTAGRITIRTDVLAIEIDRAGGDIRQVDLLAYPVAADKPDQPFRLMGEAAEQVFVTETGLLNAAKRAPTHHAVYTTPQNDYQLAADANTLEVPLTWRDPSGITVRKVFTFHRDSYLIELRYEVENESNDTWRGNLYRQFKRNETARESTFIYTYTGAVVSRPDKPYEKISFDDMRDSPLVLDDVSGGWVAMIQHYFLAAWVADTEEVNRFYTKVSAVDRYLVGMISAPLTVEPGGSGSLQAQLFVGPKLQRELETIAPHLELTVDYGWLTFLAKPLFWLLEQIHRFVGNWGWSILILTLLIKLAFYKLSETSYKSMANMRRLHPKLTSLKERFGDDKAAMQRAMMDLYKREKINPLGGCLPILVQIPVFIALYWVLLESVEMRQAPFILWLNDLSSADPYFVLPLLMGVTMFLQQKLNPAPLDPIQAKVMMMLPVVFTVFFAFFPAGLVLYWTANNVLSIAQQWVITRRIAPATS